MLMHVVRRSILAAMIIGALSPARAIALTADEQDAQRRRSRTATPGECLAALEDAHQITINLHPSVRAAMDDAAGRWQHEGGRIMKGAALVGHYSIHRRVTFGGTDAQNTAMTTVTLFFAGTPPQNVTLQGAHAFSTGRFAGSVSASSNRYAWIHAADAVIAPTAVLGTSTLTLQWTGANQLTLP